jgi:type I restriction enzyme, S subunit
MNNETMMLLERHFDAAFAAPDGIKKLRELILTLAMQGKLVPQDPNDEPASELLKKMTLEKQQLAKEGAIKDSVSFLSIRSENTPYETPAGWVWVCLGQIAAKIGSGSTPRGGKNVYVESGIPFLRSQNVWNDGLRLNDVAFISSETNEKMHGTKVASGDILLNITGASLGRCAIVPSDFEGANVSQHVTIIRLIDHRLRKYIHLLLLSPYCQNLIWSRQVGVSREGLSKKVLEQFEILLPPLAEQKRIVAEIDRLMARCDELEKLRADRSQKLLTVHTAALDNLLKAKESSDFGSAWHFITQNFSELYSVKENVAELRKAILQLAVMGKLVPQESAPQIGSLQSILAESSINGVSKGPTSDTSATEVLRISAGTSQKDFYVNENDFKHVDLSASEIQKFKLVAGDLLACRFNGNLHYVGRFSYYRGESGRLQVNPDKLIRFRIDTESHCPRYVCYMMNAAQTRDVIEAMCATTAGNIGLSAGRLKTIKIPLPPLARQHRIVVEIDRLMGMCDRLEESIEAAKSKQTDLLNALMSHV